MLDAASFSDQPRLVIAATTCGFQGAGADAAGAAAVPVPCGTSLPASSSTILPATLGPIPGTLVKAFPSPVCAATRIASGSWTASTARARRGPTPLTLSRTSKTSRSSSLENPNSVSESSRTIRDVKSLPSSPVRSPLRVWGVALTLMPAPLRSITAEDNPTWATVPRRKLIKAGLLGLQQKMQPARKPAIRTYLRIP
ncbi:hypothetical protein D9M72_367160 [compost metagenome]